MWRSITIWHISMAHCIAISISIPIPICINLLIAVTEVRCNVECVWQNKQWDISDLQPSINKVKSIRFHVAALAGRNCFQLCMMTVNKMANYNSSKCMHICIYGAEIIR